MTSEVQCYILLFFAMSVLGWCIEVLSKYIEFGRFINRGFLIGPYCPIYGAGSVLIVLMVERYSDSPVIVFLMAMIVCGTLEYITSYIMEKLFHARWWDYSHKRFNLDGRVCAGTLIPFGLLGLALLYIIKPVLFRLFARIPSSMLNLMCILLCILFAADIGVSTNILDKVKRTADLSGADDTETLTRAVRETLAARGILFRRTLRAFPYAKLYNNRLHEQLKLRQSNISNQSRLRRRQLQEEFRKLDEKKRAAAAERKQRKSMHK